MIHLTLIIVDFLTGLIMAGAWALVTAAAGIGVTLFAGISGVTAFRRWRNRK